ncbi:hypothetical protein DY000_02006533 [Brassica cretica]|uniref:Uncharacterized protein n=1 Tax=Brassica cretica TaxID=69181 RepID=A0ABQ7BW51_BRACR|nr:hypothetical protein DY000_02006533 [Brassica cretica]
MSRLSQYALSKGKTLKTKSTLLEVRVIPCCPFKTSEHMRCSCLSKGDATWLVHEWVWDQMDQLGLSSEVANAYGMSSLGNMANPLRKIWQVTRRVEQVRYAIESGEGPGLAYSNESKWN